VQSKAFELLAPTRLNNVCFTLNGEENQEKVLTFLTKLNQTGQVFMTSTEYNGKKGIRAAFVNWRTTENDIDIAIEQMGKVQAEL
jgi:glutamate/tyrosine decarboxylase-like PLP-dependent enzyme